MNTDSQKKPDAVNSVNILEKKNISCAVQSENVDCGQKAEAGFSFSDFSHNSGFSPNPDLLKAFSLLNTENSPFSLVLCEGETVITSDKRGVEPLLNLIDSKKDFSRCSAADKVIGKAAAFLYVLLGIKSIYANTISEEALKIFDLNFVNSVYKVRTDKILNRSKNGFCPMESAVLSVHDANEAEKIIRAKFSLLKNHRFKI